MSCILDQHSGSQFVADVNSSWSHGTLIEQCKFDYSSLLCNFGRYQEDHAVNTVGQQQEEPWERQGLWDERKTGDSNNFSSTNERICRNINNSQNSWNSSTIKDFGYTRNIRYSSCMKSTSEFIVRSHILLETIIWMKIESSRIHLNLRQTLN